MKKKAEYIQLLSENILMSILSAFHHFLTLANKSLEREKGTFFAVRNVPIKSGKN